MFLRLPARSAGVRFLWLILLVAASVPTTRGAALGAGGSNLEVISPGAAPVTETWTDMVARERQFRTRFPGGLRMLPPIPPNPRIRRPRVPGQPGPERYTAPAGPESRLPGSRAPQTLGTNFRGVSFDDQVTDLSLFTLPPDTTGVVGPSHFMQIINGSVAIFSKAGVRLSHISLDAFSAITVNNVTYPRNSGFDPRLIYDRRSGRWFATIMDRGNPVATDNDIILAVSRTSDPTGTWDKYLLPVGDASNNGVTYFTDYSTLAVDDNGVYAGMTIFPSNAPAFAKLIATPKAPLLAGTPSLGTVYQATNITDLFSSPQPAHNYDAVGPGGRAWFVSSSTAIYGDIHYRTITWNGGIPALTTTAILATPAYGDVNLLDAPTSGSATPADTGDDRLQMAIIRNGRLWTCRTVGVNASGTNTSATRTACEWLELDVTSSVATLVQSGRVFDPAPSNPRYYAYPSVMVSGQGHAMLGFSGIRSNEFIGAYMAGRLAGDPLGTLRTIDTIKAGESAYSQLDSSGRNRWGDYSYTSLDPADDMTFWTIQEYANPQGVQFLNGSKSRWSTWIGQGLAPAPTLSNPAAAATLGQNGVVVQLNGTNFFDPGAGFANRLSVQVSGSGVTVTGVTFISPTQATATLNVSGGAATGPRTLTIVNPDGQSASAVGGLTIVGSTVEFSAANYTNGEGNSTITITVNRNGTAGAASVTYSAQPGTAIAGDFTPTSNILNFGPGEASKTFNVAGIADNLLEGDETVLLSLSSPSGVSLGTQSTATLTLTDNLTTPAPSGPQATVLGPGQIRIAWTDNCGNEDGFRVERRSGGVGSFTPLSSIAASPFVDATAAIGIAYTYRVVAVRGNLESNPSPELNATIPAGAKMRVTPAAKLAFGRIRLTRPPTKVLKITNLGRGTLYGSVGTVPAPYEIVQGAGSFVLARNKSHTVKIKFAPAAPGTAFPGSITITGTDPAKPQVVVLFTGAAR